METKDQDKIIVSASDEEIAARPHISDLGDCLAETLEQTDHDENQSALAQVVVDGTRRKNARLRMAASACLLLASLVGVWLAFEYNRAQFDIWYLREVRHLDWDSIWFEEAKKAEESAFLLDRNSRNILPQLVAPEWVSYWASKSSNYPQAIRILEAAQDLPISPRNRIRGEGQLAGYYTALSNPKTARAHALNAIHIADKTNNFWCLEQAQALGLLRWQDRGQSFFDRDGRQIEVWDTRYWGQREFLVRAANVDSPNPSQLSLHEYRGSRNFDRFWKTQTRTSAYVETSRVAPDRIKIPTSNPEPGASMRDAAASLRTGIESVLTSSKLSTQHHEYFDAEIECIKEIENDPASVTCPALLKDD